MIHLSMIVNPASKLYRCGWLTPANAQLSLNFIANAAIK